MYNFKMCKCEFNPFLSWFCNSLAVPCDRVYRTGLCKLLEVLPWSDQSCQSLLCAHRAAAWPLCWWWEWYLQSWPGLRDPSTRIVSTHAGKNLWWMSTASGGRWHTYLTSQKLQDWRAVAEYSAGTWILILYQSLRKPLEPLCLLHKRDVQINQDQFLETSVVFS